MPLDLVENLGDNKRDKLVYISHEYLRDHMPQISWDTAGALQLICIINSKDLVKLTDLYLPVSEYTSPVQTVSSPCWVIVSLFPV